VVVIIQFRDHAIVLLSLDLQPGLLCGGAGKFGLVAFWVDFSGSLRELNALGILELFLLEQSLGVLKRVHRLVREEDVLARVISFNKLELPSYRVHATSVVHRHVVLILVLNVHI